MPPSAARFSVPPAVAHAVWGLVASMMVDQRFVARGLVALALLYAGVANGGCSHNAVPTIVGGTSGSPAVAPHLIRGPASYYVSLPALGVIEQVDPATGQIFNTFFAPGVGLLLADSAKPRVFGISGDSIVVIGTVFQHARTSIPLPEPVVSWALASRAGQLYVAGAQTVYVISTASYKIIATVAMPSTIGAIAVSPGHNKVFVTMPAINRIGVIDTPADVLEKRPIFEGPCNVQECQAIAIASSADGRYVVALSRRGTIFHQAHSFSIGIDAASNAILSKTPLSCTDFNPRFIGQNDAKDLAWFVPCGHASPMAPVSLQPPFDIVSFGDDFQGRRVPIQAAFDPSGAGYAIGVCESHCRGSFLLSISTTNVAVQLGELPSTPGGIAYAPLITH